MAFRIEPPAGLEILIRDNDTNAATCCRQRSHEARRSRADHQDIAVCVRLVIVIGIFRVGAATETGSATNERLVHFLPEGRRPHESFVVKAGRKKAAREAVQRQDVETEARPAVLALGLKTVEQLHRRRARVGLAAGAGSQLDECVRLLAARRENAARAMILEGSTD